MIRANPSCEWQQGDVARLLDRQTQPALVRRAHAGQTPRRDLAALGHKLGQQTHVFVIDGFNLLGAEFADFFAPKIFAATWAAFAAASAGARARWTPLAAWSVG